MRKLPTEVFDAYSSVSGRADPGVNKSTATTAIQRILPDSDVVMDVAGPSQSEGR